MKFCTYSWSAPARRGNLTRETKTHYCDLEEGHKGSHRSADQVTTLNLKLSKVRQ